MEVPKSVLDMYSNPESDRYDLDKYEELKNSYAFVSSALYGLGHSLVHSISISTNGSVTTAGKPSRPTHAHTSSSTLRVSTL